MASMFNSGSDSRCATAQGPPSIKGFHQPKNNFYRLITIACTCLRLT